MADTQEELKEKYRLLAGKRRGAQDLVNQELAKWNGEGAKPTALAEAEMFRDQIDFELAKVTDKFKF